MINALEAYRDVLREIDKHGAPTFTVLDFNYWYNSTIDEYVAQQYSEFDITQKKLDNLSSIIQLGSPLSFANNIGTLPTKYRHLLYLEVVLKFTKAVDDYAVDDTITVRKVQRLRTNRKGFVEENAYHDPSHRMVYYQIAKLNALHILAGDNVTVTSGKLDYIEIPDTIYLNPDKSADFTDPSNNTPLQFPLTVNYEIGKECARRFLENIESPRYQSSLNEQALRERAN